MTDLYSHLETEEEKRDVGMALAADSSRELLNWLRVQMVRLYRVSKLVEQHEEPFVTADDARKILAEAIEAGTVARPKCMNFLGSLFKAPGWVPAGGFIKSKTPGSHANRLVKWKFIGESPEASVKMSESASGGTPADPEHNPLFGASHV